MPGMRHAPRKLSLNGTTARKRGHGSLGLTSVRAGYRRLVVHPPPPFPPFYWGREFFFSFYQQGNECFFSEFIYIFAGIIWREINRGFPFRPGKFLFFFIFAWAPAWFPLPPRPQIFRGGRPTFIVLLICMSFRSCLLA